jgi:hypothetical protein
VPPKTTGALSTVAARDPLTTQSVPNVMGVPPTVRRDDASVERSL